MSRIIKQILGEKLLPPEMQKKLDAFRCLKCAENSELPRKPKLAIPPEATPNLTVSLDVMQQKINQKPNDILVIIYHGDMFIRLKLLSDRTPQTSFNAFYSYWISIFDGPLYVIVDRGSNLSAEERRGTSSSILITATSNPHRFSLG